MALNEFSLIEEYFSFIGKTSVDPGSGIALGVGDDGAVLDIPPGDQLVVTVDTLVAGVHFPKNAAPADIAHRALRVNLSDIAAMGAEPRWFTLALTLPEANKDWLQQFSQALAEDAERFNCSLVGGDTTAGPPSITIQLLGTVRKGKELTRSGAQTGDKVYVTGTLGEGAAALPLFGIGDPIIIDHEVDRQKLLQRFYQPQPRINEGLQLRGLASAALDISDGLLADLGHIAKASNLGAEIHYQHLPVAPWLKALANPERVKKWVLSGGDDYELCFTVPEQNCAAVDTFIEQGELSARCIGQMTSKLGVRCFDAQGHLIHIDQSGYQHF